MSEPLDSLQENIRCKQELLDKFNIENLMLKALLADGVSLLALAGKGADTDLMIEIYRYIKRATNAIS